MSAEGMMSPTHANGRFARPVEAVDKDVFDEPWDPEEVLNLTSVKPGAPVPLGTLAHRATVLATKRRFFAFRSRVLVLWLGVNWLAVTLIDTFGFQSAVTWGLIGYGAYVTSAHTFGSLLYLFIACTCSCGRTIKRLCCRCCRPASPTTASVSAAPKAGQPAVNDDAQSASTHGDSAGDDHFPVDPHALRRQSALSAGKSVKVMRAAAETDTSIGTELREAEAVGVRTGSGKGVCVDVNPSNPRPITLTVRVESRLSGRPVRQDSTRRMERVHTPTQERSGGRSTPSHLLARHGASSASSRSIRHSDSPAAVTYDGSASAVGQLDTETPTVRMGVPRSFRDREHGSFRQHRIPTHLDVTSADEAAIARAAAVAMDMHLNPHQLGLRDILDVSNSLHLPSASARRRRWR